MPFAIPRIRPILGRAALLLAIVALCGGGVEGFTRLVLRYPYTYPAVGMFETDPELGYRLTPGFSGSYVKDGRPFPVRTNPQGFRDPRDFDALSPDSARILLVGDSFAFGMPVEAEQTLGAALERRLDHLAPEQRWEVLNLGVPSYNTAQEALVLERWADRLDPDAVLLAFCIANDITDSRFPPQAPAYRAHRGIQVTPEAARHGSSGPWGSLAFRGRMLLLRSAAYQLAQTALANLLPSVGPEDASIDAFATLAAGAPNAEAQLGWDNTRRALDAIIDRGLRQGLPLVVLVVPHKPQVLERARRLAEGGEPDLEQPRRMLLDFLRDRGVAVVDATDALAEAPDPAALFEEYGTHLLESGNRRVGEPLAEAIVALFDRKDPSAQQP